MELRRVTGWLFVVLGAIGILVSFALSMASGVGILFGIVLFPLAAAIPLALVVVGWRMTRPRAPEPVAAPPARAVVPVPVVPESEAEALKLPIDACPRCGYLGIRMPTIHDGLWPGGGETGARMVCSRCDWQGLPASFTSGAEYVEFVRGLNERAPTLREGDRSSEDGRRAEG